MKKLLTTFLIIISITYNTESKVNYMSKTNKRTLHTRVNGINLSIDYLNAKSIVNKRKNDNTLKETDVESINLKDKKIIIKNKKLKHIKEDEYLLHGTLEYYKYKYGKKVILERVQYKYGIRNGQSEEYYPNGKIKKIENYLNDELDGFIISYDKLGDISQKLYYKKGKLIKKY